MRFFIKLLTMKKTNPIIEYIYPKRILSSSLCLNKKIFLKKYHLIHSFETNNCATMRNNGHIVLDFDMEYSGGIRILTVFHPAKNNLAKLRIRLGESLGEVNQEFLSNYAGNDHSPRDFTVEVPQLSDLTFGNSGFRFVRIDNISGVDIILRAVLLSYQHINLKPKGYFICDDERINKIFDISLRTAYMCIQNGFLVEAIKRDRLVWSGDLYVQLKTTLDILGCFDAVTNSLDALKKVNSLDKWMSGIPSYSIWYLLNVNEVYKFSGDKKWLNKHIGYMKSIVIKLGEYLKEENASNRADFIDWTSNGNKDCNAAVSSFAVYAFKTIKPLFDDSTFIDEIINRIKIPNIDQNTYKGIRAIYEYGKHDYPEALLNDGVNTMSTFLSYAVYDIMDKNGFTSEATEKMKEYYGMMLDINATTFFEAYDSKWVGGKVDEYDSNKLYFHQNYGDYCYKGYRLSLCHAWRSGPVPFLLENVSGIQRIDDTTYKIEPHMGNLRHIKAGIMTKNGLLKIELNNKQGKIEYKLDVPKGIKII